MTSSVTRVRELGRDRGYFPGRVRRRDRVYVYGLDFVRHQATLLGDVVIHKQGLQSLMAYAYLYRLHIGNCIGKTTMAMGAIGGRLPSKEDKLVLPRNLFDRRNSYLGKMLDLLNCF